MEIREKSFVMRNIGKLDGYLILPTARRIAFGMKTICEKCGKSVTDEKFLGGFKKGMHNMIFHVSCVPESDLPFKP